MKRLMLACVMFASLLLVIVLPVGDAWGQPVSPPVSPLPPGKPLTTLTFDELPFQPVNGLAYRGVTFGFEVGGAPSGDAYYHSYGPGMITYIQDPSLEGSATGILTVEFSKPTAEVEFGVALSTLAPLDPGVVVDLYKPGKRDRIRRSVSLETNPDVSFSEGLFSYSGPAVKTVVISFNAAAADRFALDNLSYHKGKTGQN